MKHCWLHRGGIGAVVAVAGVGVAVAAVGESTRHRGAAAVQPGAAAVDVEQSIPDAFDIVAAAPYRTASASADGAWPAVPSDHPGPGSRRTPMNRRHSLPGRRH